MASLSRPSASYALPQLPSRARLRVDDHGFREEGSKIAEERIKMLSAKIEALCEREEDLKKETETLWTKASNDLEMEKKSLKDMDRTKSEAHREIQLEIAKAVNKTHTALGDLLKQHDRGVFNGRGFAEGQVHLRGFSSRMSTAELEDPHDVEDRFQQAKRALRLDRKKLVADKKKYTTEKRKWRKLKNEGSKIARISEPDLSFWSKEVGTEGSGSETSGIEITGLGANEASGRGDLKSIGHDQRDGEEKDYGDKSTRELPQEGPGSLDEEYQELPKDYKAEEASNQQLPSQKRSEAPRLQTTGERKGKESKDRVAEKRISEKIIEERWEKYCDTKIKDQSRNAWFCKREIQNVDNRMRHREERFERQKMEAQRREEALQSEDEREVEEERKRVQEEEESERLGRQEFKARGEILQKLREDVVEEQGEAGALSRWGRRLRRYDLTYPRHRPFAWMSYNSTGRSDDEDDDPMRWRFFKGLESSIIGAQELETLNQSLQQHLLKLKGVVHLKQILEKEKWLEDQWLHQPQDQKVPDNSEGDGSDCQRRGHLLQELPVPEGVYTSLKKGNFRVLIVRPAPEPYYPLICNLETLPIRNSEDTASIGETTMNKYAALSYYWGPESCNGRIYLLPAAETPDSNEADEWGSAIRSATRIRIRNNLFRALMRFRRCGPKAQPIALWVDFMCINQNNPKEKSDQLGKMVNIYRNASNVCIWLGEPDSEGRSDEAMKFIRVIMDFAMLDRYAHDKRQAKKWYALGELMRDRWFSRRWVVQEIALSRDATVHCGAEMVQWSDFADAASLLVSNQETIKSLFDLSEWREGSNTLGNVGSFGASILLEATSNLFRRKPNGDIKWPIKTIESLVTSLKTFDTGNPRDLIYSVFSIAKDTSQHLWPADRDHNSGAELGLEVDYSRSVTVVYKDFTKFCIRSSNSLDIICRPWAMPAKDDSKKGKWLQIPSWIPTLSDSEFGVPEEVYSGRKNGEGLVGRAGSPNYRASGRRECDIDFEPEKDAETNPVGEVRDNTQDSAIAKERENAILAAHGFRLASIKQVSPRNAGGVILKESLSMGGWKRFDRNTNSVPDPIWRTLVADRDEHGRVPPSWYQRACLRCLEMADTFNNGDLNVGELLQGHSEMLRKYLVRVQNVTWNRRFSTAVVDEVGRGETCGKSLKDGPAKDFRDIQVPHEDVLTAPKFSLSAEHANQEETDVIHVEEEEPMNEAGEERRSDERGDQIEEKEEGLQMDSEEPAEEEIQKPAVVEDGDEDFGKTDVRNEEEVGGNRGNRAHDEPRSQEGDENKRYGGVDIEHKTGDKEGPQEEGEHSKGKIDKDGREEQKDIEAHGDGKAGGEDRRKNESTKRERKWDGAGGTQETLFGLCPPKTKEKDFICILYGCSVPVVLRESASGYMELIGEAYVHGKMDGEAVEDLGDIETRTEEVFRIR